jgi:hypothetical protein
MVYGTGILFYAFAFLPADKIFFYVTDKFNVRIVSLKLNTAHHYSIVATNHSPRGENSHSHTKSGLYRRSSNLSGSKPHTERDIKANVIQALH